MDPREEARILGYLEDEIGASDDSDDDHVVESNHNTESEQSDDEGGEVSVRDVEGQEGNTVESAVEDEFEGNTNDLYIAKDGTKWRMTPQANLRVRRRPCDLLRYLPGTRGDQAKNAVNPTEALNLFFSDEMLEEFVACTNIYIASIRPNFARPRDAADTNLLELKACLGLLFLGGVMKVSHTKLEDLWKTDGTGIELFRLTMGINRFKFLLKCLRFDNFNTRSKRKLQDKLAAVRFLVDGFNQNCKKHYSLSECVTIYEMLDAFRGLCGFRQYIPSKPAKYGLKIFALTDAKTYYTSKVEIYCGIQPEGPYKCSNKSEDIVKRLIEPITNSGRNVTCDNWFVSFQLAKDLIQDHNLTLVGTVKKNRKGIPEFIKSAKNRPIGSSIFAFRKDLNLVSFKPKKNKIVLALSTLHHEDPSVEDVGPLEKPSIITFYNATKSGVDKADEMKCAYSVARITRRWTLVTFFSFLNIAGINAYVVFKNNTNSTLDRNDFLIQLAKELIDGVLRMRITMTNLPVSIRLRVREILGLPEPTPQRIGKQEERTHGRCSLCDRKRNRPTRFTCKGCNKYVCLGHVVGHICSECVEKVQVIQIDNEADQE